MSSMHSLLLAACLSLWFVTTLAQAVHDRPCPLLGLNYPVPSSYGSNEMIKVAMNGLQEKITGILSNVSADSFNSTSTAFSVDIYSLHDEKSLFTYHFTPDALKAQHSVGVESVDSNSVYRVGSVSKLYTVYLYLIAIGDENWNQPVTNFVPELAAYAERSKSSLAGNTIDYVDWNSVTIGALAGQMAGLPRDGAYSGQLEQALGSFGLPPPSTQNASNCGDDARLKIPCNRAAFFEQYLLQHPVVSSFETPIYSNAAYQILAYAIENITGQAMSDVFEDELVKPLELNGTFYTVPSSTNESFIPIDATTSWWNADALDETAAGGYYSTINDMRKIGKAMLNSTLITPAQTRRWMKPHAFTSNVNFSVGAPWEILRAPGDQVSWIYTKAGNLGAYAATTALLPEYSVGISVLGAGGDPVNAVRVISDVATSVTVPAVQSAIKADAASVYSGTYTDEKTNSTITITAPDMSTGLVISTWTLAGYDVLSLLGMILGTDPTQQNVSATIYHTGLESADGAVTSWRAIYEVLPQPEDTGAFSTNCASWQMVNLYTYGGVGLDEFLFTVDAQESSAVSIQPRILSTGLLRAAGANVTVSQQMRRARRT